MLRTMREKFKHLSWTLWLVIITFIVGFSMTDIFSKKDPTMSDLLKVGKETIRKDRFEHQLYLTLENYNTQFQNKLTQQTINQLRIPEQLLQNMIATAIIQQEAEELNLTVSNQELGRQITQNPALQNNGQFIGRESYERLLEARRIRIEDFEEDYRRDILRDKLKNLVTAGITIDDATLRDIYTRQTDQAELDYIALTPETIEETFNHTEKEIEAYYTSHKEELKSPEKRSGRFLFLPFEAMKPELKLTDDDLYQYFRDHKDEFKIPAKRRISRIFLPYGETNRSATLKEAQQLSETLTAETFAETAKTRSQDSKASSGGDWGETEWQNLTKQEVSIAEKLSAGQVSTPVDSGSGFSVFFAAEATAEQYPDFNTLKPRIQTILEREKLRLLSRDLILKTAKEAEGNDNILEKDMDQRLQKIDSQPLANGDPIAGTDDLGYLSRTLFSMKAGETRSPIELPNGLALAQLNLVVEPAVQPLEQVAEQIRNALTLEKKTEKLLAKAQLISNELNAVGAENRVDEILARHKLKLENNVYRRGNRFGYYPQKDGLDEIIFTLPLNQFTNPIDLDQAVVILRAKQITVASEEEYKQKRAELFTEQLERQKDEYFNSYIASRYDRYSIQFNEPMFSEIRKNVLGRYR